MRKGACPTASHWALPGGTATLGSRQHRGSLLAYVYLLVCCSCADVPRAPIGTIDSAQATLLHLLQALVMVELARGGIHRDGNDGVHDDEARHGELHGQQPKPNHHIGVAGDDVYVPAEQCGRRHVLVRQFVGQMFTQAFKWPLEGGPW